MTSFYIDWDKIRSLTGNEFRDSVFNTIKQASKWVQNCEVDDPRVLEIVPRLVELLDTRSDELHSFREIISALARATGLWNYIDRDIADTSDLIIAESVTAPQLGGVTFHKEQIIALNTLLAGKNLILSAPTSFGKSLLIDALLATGKYQRVAIILPTIALLDEFRRRFISRFCEKFQLIMHPSDVPSKENVIFLGTQERLIYRDDLGSIDLTVVDEFYKLDPSRRDERSVTLNVAVYKLLRQSKQFFFLGPNIDSVKVSVDTRWRFEFLRTRFSTVAVDTIDFQGIQNKRQKLIDEIGEERNWPSLVFVSSPDRANILAADLADEMAVSDDSSDFADWLATNLGANGLLSRSVRYGFGVHHGRIPRAIAARMVRMFNSEKIPVLFCTSTLIEGVNTAAKTVMIFDKKINRANYDFFTFSNIKGRAGRLGQHYVGKVMLFNEVPKYDELEVFPSLFGDEVDQSDEYIVHIDEKSPHSTVEGRIQSLKDKLGLDEKNLRLVSSIGIERAIKLRMFAHMAFQEEETDLIWTALPTSRQLKAALGIICRIQKPQTFGAWSVNQLAFYIGQLSRSRTFTGFLVAQDKSYQGAPEKQDNIFKFLRACEYGLPQLFTALDAFIKQVEPKADYSFFIGALSSWFKPEILKELDEEGVPIQIAERFYKADDTKKTLTVRLLQEVELKTDKLTEFECEWLRDVLLTTG